LRDGNFPELAPTTIDDMKRAFYSALETLNRRKTASFDNQATIDLVESIFRAAPSPWEMRDIEAYAKTFATHHAKALDTLIERLAADIDLPSSTDDVDKILAQTGTDGWSEASRREVLINYLGFPFWDVLTFPVMTWREPGEFREILIDRISPLDATAVEQLGSPRLKGSGFDHFAAFFSRAYRENDYLLGRLQGFDRLVDIVCDAAGIDARNDIGMLKLKERGFLCILAAEEPHLPRSRAMIEEFRRLIGEGVISRRRFS
jgi:hypothetical protein